MKFSRLTLAYVALISKTAVVVAKQPCLEEQYEPHVVPVADGWAPAEPVITVGQTCNGYTPP